MNKYKEALARIDKTYNDLDKSISAGKRFNEDIHLLTGLVNEHFEEKQETNYEHYKDEIIENCGFAFALVDGKPHKCACVNCNDCGFSTGHGCREKVEEWLKSPYKKPVYKLTKFEKELLQCYSDIYRFKVFNSLSRMKEKGYFKGIDDNETIGDILGNCEAIK